MQNILITGASGFVGSHLTQAALAQNLNVFAGVRKTSDRSYLQSLPCHLFEMDLSNQDGLTRAFQKHLQENGGFDYIIHNAGLTQNKRNKNFQDVNYKLTQHLVNALLKSGNIPRRLIYTSSISASGPASLQANGMLDSKTKDQPVTPYGKSKKQAEQFLLNTRIPVIIFRVPPVYGPGEKNMLPIFRAVQRGLRPTLGLREQRLSMIYVKDLAGFFMHALETPHTNRIYYVSDGENYPQARVPTAIAKAMGKRTLRMRIPLWIVRTLVAFNTFKAAVTGRPNILNVQKYREIAPRNWTIDSSQTMADMGYTPRYPLEAGMHETYKWYRSHHLL